MLLIINQFMSLENIPITHMKKDHIPRLLNYKKRTQKTKQKLILGA